MAKAKQRYIEIVEEFPIEFHKPMLRLADAIMERVRAEFAVRREDFDELRSAIAELAQAQKRTEERVEELAQAQKRTEERVEELAQAQKRTEERVEELAQAQKRTEERVEELAQAQNRTEERVEELAQAQKRTEERVEELAQAQKRTEERVEELAQAQNRTEERVEELAQAQNRTEERVEELAQAQKRTEERVEELAQVQKRFEKHFDMQIGALGSRWGLKTEASFRAAAEGILGEDFGMRVERYIAYDKEGEVFGRPDQVEIDILIRDDKITAIEIKSSMSKSDVYTFDKKVSFFEKRQQEKVDRKLIITPMLDPRAEELVKTLGMKVYSSCYDWGDEELK